MHVINKEVNRRNIVLCRLQKLSSDYRQNSVLERQCSNIRNFFGCYDNPGIRTLTDVLKFPQSVKVKKLHICTTVRSRMGLENPFIFISSCMNTVSNLFIVVANQACQCGFSLTHFPYRQRK